AVDNGPLTNEPIYSQLLGEQFNALTPENATKWGSLQPVDPNHWEFEPADAIADFADEYEQVVKGHTLIWHQQLPSFIDANTTLRQLERYSTRHIERSVRHFDRAFREAQEADRDARLYYNDYGIEGINAKSTAVYDLMTRLLARHVP